MSFKFSGVNLIVHHFVLKSALVGKNDFPFSSYRKILGVMKISVASPLSAKISLSYPKQASIQCFLGGWSQRKQVDPALLHFFFDHWMFKWLPKKFRDFMRCGLESYDFTKNEKEQKVKSNTKLT